MNRKKKGGTQLLSLLLHRQCMDKVALRAVLAQLPLMEVLAVVHSQPAWVRIAEHRHAPLSHEDPMVRHDVEMLSMGVTVHSHRCLCS